MFCDLSPKGFIPLAEGFNPVLPSDSSYWLYLAHLPLVIVTQAIVRPWQLPAIVKFTLLLLLITAFLLWTYEYLVRYRWLGTFLNGKRERRVLVAAAGLGGALRIRGY